MTPILECSHLTKWFGTKQALADVTLQIQPGRIIGLLGPNGSGKSTLIKIANGLLTPTEGTISICGHPIGVETKEQVSYLPDRDYLNNWMKVSQLIDCFHDFYSNFDRNKAYEMLQRLDIRSDQKL